MAKPAFNFTLQPELVNRSVERDHALEERVRLLARLEREEVELAARKQDLLTTTKRIGTEVQRQFEPTQAGQSADTWLDRGQYLGELRALEQKQRAAFSEQGAACKRAQQALKEHEAKLAQLLTKVRALEDARQAQFEEYRAQLEKHAESKREEDALLRWSHQKRKER